MANTDTKPAVHFIGFRGEEYWSAVRVFGRPDFIHPGWDKRALREIAEGDVVIFAAGNPDKFAASNFADMIEINDPARIEASFSAHFPAP